jgi:PAS domain S-box-containing protein
MEDGVLEKARELCGKPDMIIDLYDFTVVWMSDELEKILGYKKGEMIGKTIMETFALKEEEKRKKAIEHMSKEHGFMNSFLKAKDGNKIRFDVEFYTVEFKGGFYHIGKKVKYERILAGTGGKVKAPVS